VEDAAIVLEAIAGFDALSTHARRAPDCSFVPEARADLSGIRLGLVRNFESESVEPDVARLFTGARRQLEQLGATFQTIEFAGYDPAIVRHALFLRIEAEAAAIHDALYREQPERFSPTVRGYLDYGRRMSAQKLLAADAILEAAAFAADLALEDVDALITPMMPQTAFAFASKTPANQTTYCPPANIGGLPAISVPMGVDAQGMPAGLQIVGARHAERRLLGIAALYERATSHHAHPPRPYGP
jgi:aspartyl-tRNA(Asn)/glutamyl-tRNA(Gln) amidotransferase subunit A